jgi:hypothetical protein
VGFLAGLGACAPATARVPAPAPRAAPISVSCAGCESGQLNDDVRRAIEARIIDLADRGGECAAYGAALARSYHGSLITVKPYMWRVGRQLASGEARPSGEMTLAADIDSLNVGVRSLSDLIASVEHEAVHIAFAIPSGSESYEARVNSIVRACSRPATD